LESLQILTIGFTKWYGHVPCTTSRGKCASKHIRHNARTRKCCRAITFKVLPAC